MNYSLTQTKEELIDNILTGGTAQQQIGIALLEYKLHQEILVTQEQYNAKQLWWSRLLAIGTWGLVAATLLLAVNE